MASAAARTGDFTGADGGRRAWRAWEAAAPQAVLLVVHGLSEHSGRYDEFARRCAAAGISTFALDLAGHGLSDGRRGHVSRLHVHLRDVDALRGVAVAAVPDRPFFVLGQSMGGLLALRFVQEYGAGIRGAILCSPWLGTVAAVPRWKLLLAPLMSRLIPAAPFSHGLDPAHLSRDPDAVAAYRNDPLVQGKITPRAFTEVRDAVARVEANHADFRIPLLFLMGDADHIVDTERTRRLAQDIPGDDVTTVIRPGGYHELLHEPDRNETADIIIDWINTRS
jgi:acylglycerol lipase